VIGGRYEPGYGAPVASDRDLIASRHRVEQGSEMGFGLKRANAAHGGVSTSCQPV